MAFLVLITIMIWDEELQGEPSDSSSYGVVRFAELWGHSIQFHQVAYSGVLLLWLGFRVGLKLELGVVLKLEGSFPFLNWWCLVVQKRTEN